MLDVVHHISHVHCRHLKTESPIGTNNYKSYLKFMSTLQQTSNEPERNYIYMPVGYGISLKFLVVKIV